VTVWIDSPSWPHRGTHFAHMVSDASLEELHDLAERAGVHPRGFDRDHYDVPERLVGACLDAGAVPAHTRRLVRALREAGLRLTKAEVKAQKQARAERLLARWPLPNRALATELLDRWAEPRRRYHDPRHLEHCLDALTELGGADPLVELAVWFHDAVYEGRPGADEEASARLAESRLAGVIAPADVAEVARMVRLTAGHEVGPEDQRGAYLCDADLAILGTSAEGYARYCRDVRVEYAEIPLDDFRRGRLRVLERLLALDPLYRTDRARELWAAAAERNLTREADRLRGLTGTPA
jgi:predicted metal-dependent HD superfamily phosphohydrolase